MSHLWNRGIPKRIPRSLIAESDTSVAEAARLVQDRRRLAGVFADAGPPGNAGSSVLARTSASGSLKVTMVATREFQAQPRIDKMLSMQRGCWWWSAERIAVLGRHRLARWDGWFLIAESSQGSLDSKIAVMRRPRSETPPARPNKSVAPTEPVPP